MKSLTKRQYDIWMFIKTYIEQKKISPSIREIQKEFSFGSPNAVVGHLNSLQKKGFIEVQKRVSRGVKLPSESKSLKLPLAGKLNSQLPGFIEKIRIYYIVDSNFFKQPPAFLYQMPDHSLYKMGIFKGDFLCVSYDEEVVGGDLVLAIYDNRTMAGKAKKRRGKILVSSDDNTLEFKKKSSLSFVIVKILGIIRHL